MARKPTARTRANPHVGPDVKISVSLDADTHMRLRALVLVRRTNASDLVAELVRKAVEGVRLPSVAGDGQPVHEGDAA